MKTKDIIAALFFLAVSFVIFLPMFISDKLFSWLDFIYYFMPFRELTAEIIKKGNVPLWNPYIFCGNPLMANMQSAVFYPLNVLYYVLPFTFAVKIQTLLAFFIASFSMYALVLSFKTSRLAAMLAGSVFAFGFYLTVRAVEMADLHVIIWIPAIILMARKYAASASTAGMFMLALCLAMSFLGGHPQVFSYAFILFTAFYFFESTAAGVRTGESLKKYLAVNSVFTVLILIQLAPTLEFILLSARAAEGVGTNVHISTFAGVEQAISFFLPFLATRLGRDAAFINWMGLIDIGIPCVLLFISGAIIMKKSKFKAFLFLLFAAAAAVAFAGNFKIYEIILNKLQFLGRVEYVSKINVICVIVICLVIAFTFDKLLGPGNNHKKTAIAAAAISVFMIICVLVIYAAGEKAVFVRWLLHLARAQADIAGQGSWFKLFLRDALLYSALLASFSVLLLYRSFSKNYDVNTARYAAFVLAFLSIFSYHTAGYDFYSKSWAFFDDPENTLLLKKQPDIGSTRILAPYVNNRHEYAISSLNNEASVYYMQETLYPNVPMQERFYNADGFDSLEIATFNALSKNIRTIDSPWTKPAFSLLSAGYIISQAKLEGKNLKLLSSTFSNVYKNNSLMPMVFFIPAGKNIIFTDNSGETLEGITSGIFDPQRKIYLEKKAAGVFKAMEPGKGGSRVVFNRENTNTCTVSIETESDGVAVFLDNYYPGWKAYVNSRKTKVYRANYTFKAIPVKKGKNAIKFVYDPDLFRISMYLSFMGLLIITAYFAFRWKNMHI